MEASSLSMILLTILSVFYFAIIVVLIIAMWKIFEKAGKPGWASIVPFYNIIVLLQIVEKPWWWLLLMMIPYVGAIWGIWSINLLSKKFGKDEGFTVGIVFLPFVFLPILAFGNAKFEGSQKDEQLLFA